jgi:hypothetical protein
MKAEFTRVDFQHVQHVREGAFAFFVDYAEYLSPQRVREDGKDFRHVIFAGCHAALPPSTSDL